MSYLPKTEKTGGTFNLKILAILPIRKIEN